jgi:hypothetical protein
MERASVPTFINLPWDSVAMTDQKAETAWKCLGCYRTYKGPNAEEKARACCNTIAQGVYINQTRWGKHKWYGR